MIRHLAGLNPRRFAIGIPKTFSLRTNVGMAVCVGTVLLITSGAGIAKASTISASLYTPPLGSNPVVIDLIGITPNSSAEIFDFGYTIQFVSPFPPGQGVVKGASSGQYAVPVAGVSGGHPEYLTGDYGSPLTTNIADSGNYLSTGLGSIVITFTKPQYSFALLWGSIDTSNSLTFNDVGNFQVTGSEVQAAAAGFVSNGYQGPGGSAYVFVDTSTPFTTVTAASGVVSFEFAGVAGSNLPFTSTPEPEPRSTLILGLALMSMAVVLRRRLVSASPSSG
jgi:hypothetical protein